ncbi:unnamed protein product [Prunus armeniaca]
MSSHPPNDSESAISLRSSSLRPSAPSIIRHVRCLHIPPMIQNRPSAFGIQPSTIQPSAIQPSTIGTFHHSARAMFSRPPNDSKSAISLRPSSLRRFSLRPSAFGHSAFVHQPSAIQPSAIGTFYHSARAMSSYPPNDSESAFQPSAISLRPFSLRPSGPSIIRHVRCLHIPPMIRNRPSAFRHSAFGHSTFGHRHLLSFGTCDVFTSPPMIQNRPSAFGHSAFGHPAFGHSAFGHSAFDYQPSAIQPLAIGTFYHSARAMSSHPPNDSESAFSLRPFSLRSSSLRPSAFGHSAFGHSTFGHQSSAISLRPSAFGHSAFDHSAFGPSAIQPSAIQPSAISLRPFSIWPSAFGHSAFGHSAFGHQPSAIGTFHHSERAMSSHPPNDSESASGLRPFSLRPSEPSIIRLSANMTERYISSYLVSLVYTIFDQATRSNSRRSKESHIGILQEVKAPPHL